MKAIPSCRSYFRDRYRRKHRSPARSPSQLFIGRARCNRAAVCKNRDRELQSYVGSYARSLSAAPAWRPSALRSRKTQIVSRRCVSAECDTELRRCRVVVPGRQHSRAVHTVSLLPEQVITLISPYAVPGRASRIYIVSYSKNGGIYLRTKVGYILAHSVPYTGCPK